MTEAEWLTSESPAPLLGYLIENSNPRKARLIGCAYMRIIWDSLGNMEESRDAIQVAEAFSDGEATLEELRRANQAAELTAEHWSQPALGEPVWYAVRVTSENAFEFVQQAHYEACAELDEPGFANPRTLELLRKRRTERNARWVNLVREILGNPFGPPIAPFDVPRSIYPLAEAHYKGEDCSFALRDALLEAGHVELAEHFAEKDHPKGCWALDLILGRK